MGEFKLKETVKFVIETTYVDSTEIHGTQVIRRGVNGPIDIGTNGNDE